MYQIGSLVEMKKPHACTIKATGKKANEWEVTRLGADISKRNLRRFYNRHWGVYIMRFLC